MMRLQTYAAVSFVSTLAVIYHAFNSRGQFYPATVYLSTSKISQALLLNMGLVIMCILWQLTKRFFLGSLREAEVERLNEQSWREVMEILFAITIFRQDFSVMFLAMVTTLLLIKALHWLAQKRVEYIETTPSVSMLSHIRIVSFMGFLLLVDSLFFYSSLKHLIQTRQASVSVFFSFEYMILATTTISTFVKYVFYVSDMLMEGQWERKAVYTFYLELIRDLVHLTLYLCFFFVIFLNYGVPLHLIRELYETFRNFKLRVADYVRYRKITSNMNDRFPDATPEELTSSDATCIICREEMTTAKKLICGHLFHVHCLRSWLERQHTCPTCRALVIPTDNGTNTSAGQHGAQQAANQQGTGESSGSVQGSAENGVPSDNLSLQKARLQAAAAATSIYERSHVYPYSNSMGWSPGYTLRSQGDRPLSDSIGSEADGVQQPSNGHSQHFENLLYAQFPHSSFIPFQTPGANTSGEERLSSEGGNQRSQFEAQKKFLQHQIEVLQNQLQLLQKPKSEESMEPSSSTSSDKGKMVASSVPISDGDQHGHEQTTSM